MSEGKGQAQGAGAGMSSTSDEEGRELLKTLRDRAFDSSSEKLATGLGRPVDEIERFLTGAEPLDEDVILKARGIAQERGVS